MPMSINGAAHSHGDRSLDSELPEVKFHTCTQVGMRYLKYTNLPNSEVGNNESIGIRAQKPQLFTPEEVYSLQSGGSNR